MDAARGPLKVTGTENVACLSLFETTARDETLLPKETEVTKNGPPSGVVPVALAYVGSTR